METKRRNRLLPEGTARALLLENVMASIVLTPDKKGKMNVVFYNVEEQELLESTQDYLVDEDVHRAKRLSLIDRSDVADECKHFSPVIPGKRKYYSCDYCKTSRECLRYIRSRKAKKN